ncbi:MAG: dihydropteroate synthase [Bdellovibrionales bacterium]
MGVVNVTPDSFSDGGSFFDVSHAIEHALMLDKEGADILDIGGESTRPGSTPVSPQEEMDRVVPVIEALSTRTEKTISIDTRHTEVMKACISAGATFINDVNALQDDGAVDVVAKSELPVCLMHMQKTPDNMQEKPAYDNVVEEVFEFLSERLSACLDAGILKDNIVIDIGIGFGKTLDHNLTLLRHIDRFHALGVPILLGTSRKSFIGKISNEDAPKNRLGGSISSVLYGMQKGAQVFRVHDVAQTVQAFDVYRAVDGHQDADD